MPRRVSSALMFPRFSASWIEGAVMRTISQPASTNSMTSATVACVSMVSAMVMDCTRIGLLPPTPTSPTMTSRVLRRL